MNNDGMFYVGADPRDPRSYVWLPADAFRRHELVTGPSGCGKSGYIEDAFLQRVVAGEGCLVIDPKGDTARDILAFIAMLPEEEWPALARDIVLVNPADNVVPAAFILIIQQVLLIGAASLGGTSYAQGGQRGRALRAPLIGLP